MPLDLSKLRKAKRKQSGKVVAQCPACAETGHDTQGNHLVIYSDGRFGCAANPGDAKHRREIFRLCGVAGEVQQPKSIPVKRPAGWNAGAGNPISDVSDAYF